MGSGFPAELRAAVAALLEGKSRVDLGRRSAAISDQYRAGSGSAGVIATEDDAVAYAITRMPATFAAVEEVLARIAEAAPEFAPGSLIDVGAGPGTASWAVVDRWASVKRVLQIERNPQFARLAKKLAAGGWLAEAEALPDDVLRWRPDVQADLVVAAYALVELAPTALAPTVAKLWEATGGVLAIVEPGTPAGWERMMAVRDQLLELGGRILAPCPHAAACPTKTPSWCHFNVRLSRTRDHMQAKGATVPFEDEKFCYLAVAREGVTAGEGGMRIVEPSHVSKSGARFSVCARSGELKSVLIEKRDRESFNAVKRLDWGDLIENS